MEPEKIVSIVRSAGIGAERTVPLCRGEIVHDRPAFGDALSVGLDHWRRTQRMQSLVGRLRRECFQTRIEVNIIGTLYFLHQPDRTFRAGPVELKDGDAHEGLSA